VDELRKQNDNARYFYELKANDSMSIGRSDGNDDDGNGNGNGSSANRVCYKRYRLSDEKTFGSLFFRQKESVLKLLNHFQAKTGKYQIQGYPHKLGLLLHGAPGSGKSSLIKALAQYTGRSIINVPLSRVSTNTELMSIFFDHRKYVEGESVPIKLSFKDVIFVMEDVDAASKVVKRRDGKMMKARRPTTAQYSSLSAVAAAALDYNDDCEDDDDGMPKPKSFWRLLLESNEDDCKELVKKLLARSIRLRREAAKPELLTSIAGRVAALPGLGLVGDVSQTKDNVTLQRIGNDALRTARQLEEDQATVDRYVARQARILLNMFEQQQQEQQDDDENKEHDQDDNDCNNSSSELDDTFVDELLLTSPHDYSFDANETATAVTTPANDSDDDENTPNRPLTATSSCSQLMNQNNKSPEKPNKTMIGPVAGPSLRGKSSSPFLKDELNLSGLLNVLDGVVDSPGRIVIMTTNHVDHLDPALIRPGRIDKQLLLGYMEAVDVLSMLEHYFQLTLTKQQRLRVETVITGCGSCPPREQEGQSKSNCNKQPRGRSPLQLTPAQIEQIMAEHDEIEDMITALEEYDGSLLIGY
jgi:hypothetical protein